MAIAAAEMGAAAEAGAGAEGAAGAAQGAQRAASSATGPAGRLTGPASPSTKSPSSSTRSPGRIRRAAGAAANLPGAGVSAVRSAGGGRGRGSRLAVAIAVGVIALEVMSYVTGQYFALDWQGLGKQPLKPAGADKPYLPLYAGQQAQLAAIATGQVPATMAQQSQAAQLLHANSGATLL